MKFSVLADIHGNAFALSAVLADMRACCVSQALTLGDHFSGPIDAAGTAKLLLNADFPSIRGNHDRWLIEKDPDEMGPSDRVAFDQLDQAALDWLTALPPTRTVFDDVFMCHGTPKSDLTYWLERVDDTGQVRPAHLHEVEQEAVGVEAKLILCAHTHIPRVVRLRDGRTVLNPGSVGCPAYDDDMPVYHHMQSGTPNASYAIVEGSGSDWSVTFRSIPYDTASAARLAERNGRAGWARALMTGWYET